MEIIYAENLLFCHFYFCKINIVFMYFNMIPVKWGFSRDFTHKQKLFSSQIKGALFYIFSIICVWPLIISITVLAGSLDLDLVSSGGSFLPDCCNQTEALCDQELIFWEERILRLISEYESYNMISSSFYTRGWYIVTMFE